MGINDREQKRKSAGVASAIISQQINNQQPEQSEQKKPGRPKSGAKKKITFNLPADLYADTQKIAYMNRSKSFSQIVESLLTDYVKLNREVLEAYDKLPAEEKKQ